MAPLNTKKYLDLFEKYVPHHISVVLVNHNYYQTPL